MKKLFKKYEVIHEIPPFDKTFNDVEFNDKTSYKKALRRSKVGKGFKIAFATLGVIVLVFGVVPTSIFFLAHIRIRDTFHYEKKKFNQSEMSEIDRNGVQKLTNITYPEYDNYHEPVAPEFIENVKNFTFNIFNNNEDRNNFGFAPISIYNQLEILSYLADDEYLDIFDELLGETRDLRKKDCINAFKNNYFDYPYRENSFSYMYNGLFFDNELELNNSTLWELQSLYTEVYKLDLSRQDHVNLMLKWVEEHSLIKIKQDELEIDELTKFLLFSTFYFEDIWVSPYDKKSSSSGEFLDLDGNIQNVDFMNHKYYSEVYEYEDYVSFSDRYVNHTITYLTPKNREDNIFNILKNKNFLIEDEKLLQYHTPVDLTIPKFETNYVTNLESLLKNSRGEELFDSKNGIFNDAFNSKDDLYLKKSLQKTNVKFDEEGTKVQTVSLILGGAAAEPLPQEGYKITLDSPFVYIIKDSNGIPIYLGSYSYPNR